MTTPLKICPNCNIATGCATRVCHNPKCNYVFYGRNCDALFGSRQNQKRLEREQRKSTKLYKETMETP